MNKVIPITILSLLFIGTLTAQDLSRQQLDSLYNLFLQIRTHTATNRHAAVQSIDTTHIKCGLGIVSSIKSNLNLFTPAQKSVLQSLLGRPSTDTSFVTPGGFFRVHFTKADTPDYIPDEIRNSIITSDEMQSLKKKYLDSLAIALDSVYNFEINYLGYPPPPSDKGSGGDDRYDIYITRLNGEYAETNWEDESISGSGHYISYMLIQSDFSGFYTNGINAARVTVAHEFHHAIQFGNYVLHIDRDRFFYEITSTSMEHFVYPSIRDYIHYLPEYFSKPEYSFGKDKGNRIYALAIWNIFLKDNFGYDIIKKQWELMPKMRALQAITNSLLDYNTSFREQLNKFGIWTYFTNYRSVANSYFEDAVDYPLISSIKSTKILTSSIPFQVYTAPVTNNFITIINPQNTDTLVSLITNSDIDNGINNTDTALTFSFTLYNFAQDGSIKLADNYYESFSADKPSFWMTSAILNNGVIDTGSYVIQNKDYVFPAPFNYKKNSYICIPARPDTYGSSEVNIYTVTMKLVYSTYKNVNYIYGQKVVKWDGLDNQNNKLATGVYIYVTKSGDEIKKGKLVIFNE